MSSQGSLREWYRFLDAQTENEAAGAILRLSVRFDEICTELAFVAKGMGYSPDGDIEDCLRLSLTALGDAIDLLNDVLRRIRSAEEPQSA
jgi:hypothetical protein